MPTQTFFNLPEEKRSRLIELAIDEFAEHDFENASVSRIVARAGIAKGSLYQYFANKEDLYLYLIQLAQEEKAVFIARHRPPSPQMGLFPYLRWLMEVGTAFRLARPKLERVVQRALSSARGLRGETLRRLKAQSHAYWRQLVEMGMQNGDVDPSYDADLVAWVFALLSTELGSFVLTRLKDEAGGVPLGEQYAKQVGPLFAEVLRLLEFGLRPRQEEGDRV